MHATTDYLKLHFAVLLFGFSGVVGKLITIPAVEMVFYRTLLAALGMAALLLARKRSIQVSGADWFRLFLTGFIVAAHWITFFLSARVSNVSVSLVGFATASLWTALLDPFFRKDRIRILELAFGILVMVGLYIIFSADFNYPLGLLLGIISGLTCALFSIINSRMVKTVSAPVITLYEMAGACVATALFFPFYIQHWAEGNTLHLSPSTMDWVGLIVLAWVCSVYAYSVAVELMKRIPVFFVQLTMNLEPVYGIVIAVLVFGATEKMDLRFYAGTFIVLLSVLLYPTLKRRFTASPPSPDGP